eukprot:288811_1
MHAKHKYDEVDELKSPNKQPPTKKQKINNNPLIHKVYEHTSSTKDTKIQSSQDNVLLQLAMHLSTNSSLYNKARVYIYDIRLFGKNNSKFSYSVKYRNDVMKEPQISFVAVFDILREYNVILEGFDVNLYSCYFMKEIFSASSFILRCNPYIKELDLINFQYAFQQGLDTDNFNTICKDIIESDLHCLSTIKLGGNLNDSMIRNFCDVIVHVTSLTNITLSLMASQEYLHEEEIKFDCMPQY